MFKIIQVLTLPMLMSVVVIFVDEMLLLLLLHCCPVGFNPCFYSRPNPTVSGPSLFKTLTQQHGIELCTGLCYCVALPRHRPLEDFRNVPLLAPTIDLFFFTAKRIKVTII